MPTPTVGSERIAVAGDSVGGNMATVMTLLAKERKGPEIAFQLLLYPVTDANFDTESYHAFAEGPWLTLEAMKWFWVPMPGMRAAAARSPPPR